MDPNYDLLRLGFDLSSKTFNNSRTNWHALLSSTQSATNLPYFCSNVKVLNETPSIPLSADVTECIGKNSLSLEGYSKWSVSPADKISSDTCELSSFKKNLSRNVCIGNSHPKTCNLSAENIPESTGFQQLQKPVGNYLCVFVLGWSYILSVRMIALRRRTAYDKVVYTDIHAQWDGGQGDQICDCFDLDIGSDDMTEVHWWAAILAEGRGWKATLTRGGKQYYPPWECHLDSSPFRLRHYANLPSPDCAVEPPSATEAYEYLYNFARFLMLSINRLAR